MEHDALRRDLDLSLSAEDWDVRSSGLGERPRTTTVRRRTVIARRLAMTVRRRTAIARRAP